jgi:hypothetical protein
MPKLSDAARTPVSDGVVWRHCVTCGELAALAPDTERCERCNRADDVLPVDAFISADVETIRFAGNIFASSLIDLAHHHLDGTGWAYHNSAPVELARLWTALDQMNEAVDEARRHLRLVRQRATARARLLAGDA